MNKQNFLLILVVTAFLSCKNDTKSSDSQITNAENEQLNDTYKDDEIEEALYTGYFVKSEAGFDVVLKDNILYLLKSNATDAEKSNHFFLHILPKNGKEINMDFAPSEFKYNEQLSNNFANVVVYKRELPKTDGTYDINLGQFTVEKRTWETYIQVANLNMVDNKYHNQYVQNAPNNRYLKEFESAFNDGYFMKNNEGFDLLLSGHSLYYIKANGADKDVKDMFFLHVKFEGKEDIHNLDFKGDGYQINKLLGKKFENFVVLKREIPDLGKIIEIDTGQFDKNTRSWSVLYDITKLYDDMNFIYNDQYKGVIKSE